MFLVGARPVFTLTYTEAAMATSAHNDARAPLRTIQLGSVSSFILIDSIFSDSVSFFVFPLSPSFPTIQLSMNRDVDRFRYWLGSSDEHRSEIGDLNTDLQFSTMNYKWSFANALLIDGNS